MKTKILSILLILALAVPLMAAPPAKHKSAETSALIVDNVTFIDANNILMFVTNHGNFARDLTNMFHQGGPGAFFPYTGLTDLESGAQATSVNFASGLWIGGTVGGETRVTIAEYSDEYVPGPMVGGTYSPDIPDYHVFKLHKDSLANNPNQDYLDWDIAAAQGAPTNPDGTPEMIGDQMLWAVFNDADTAQHTNDAGETLPLGLEVRQTTFAFDREDPLGNVIFIRLRVFNRGSDVINNCYFSLWADPDLGGAGDDLVACDVDKSLGYVYNANNQDAQYSNTPPCLGYDFFQGPMVASVGDTARMWGTTFPDMKNLGMVSFNRYINGTDPNNFGESYNYMQGLGANGDPYVYEGDTLLYMHAGDPVLGTGDLDIDPADRRFMQSTGPITFAPGDSTEILAAIIVGQGSDRLSSISVMKFYDQFAQSAYDIDFDLPEPPATPRVGVAHLHGEVSLFWTDTSETDNGDYPFEGYTVYQGESAAGPWKRVANYDISNGVGTILDDVIDIETGTLENRGVKFGTDPGVRRYHSAVSDAILGGKLNDITTYYYKVEAYSYDAAATPKTLTSAAIITVTPQTPTAGIEHSFFNGDTIAVNHTGGSDGAVLPVVLDPENLNGHTYQVIFEDTMGLVQDTHYLADGITIDWIEDVVNVGWHLYDLNDGDTTAMLRWQPNQSGDDDYLILDGMIVKITGPALLGLDWDYTSATPANISPNATLEYPGYTGGRWITSASGSDGELFFGGIYLGVNFNGSSLSPADYRDAEIRFTPLASYTDLNSDGEYTPGEPYVVADPSATQDAFMYGGFSDGAYAGFNNVPFTAWDVSDPANARQLNVVVRDRDGNGQWDLHHDVVDAALPNGGDIRFNYVWILNTDYDATGTLYGDGTGGTIGFMSTMSGAMWTGWFGDRGNGGMLAEEGTMFLDAPAVNTVADTFTFVAIAPTSVANAAALEDIKVVPNPFYLYSSYDPSVGNSSLKFTHLPTKCTISIYNLAGEFVSVIDKDDASTSIAEWNGNTYNGLPVASGIYIYVVDAEGYGQKIGKFAIFKETEVLKNF